MKLIVRTLLVVITAVVRRDFDWVPTGNHVKASELILFHFISLKEALLLMILRHMQPLGFRHCLFSHVTSYHVTSYFVMLCDITSHHVTLSHIIVMIFCSSWIWSFYCTSRYVTSRLIIVKIFCQIESDRLIALYFYFFHISFISSFRIPWQILMNVERLQKFAEQATNAVIIVEDTPANARMLTFCQKTASRALVGVLLNHISNTPGL